MKESSRKIIYAKSIALKNPPSDWHFETRVCVDDRFCKALRQNFVILTIWKRWKLLLTRFSGSFLGQRFTCDWLNGLGRLQRWPRCLQKPESEYHQWTRKFFSCNKVFPLTNQDSMLASVPCASKTCLI